VNGLCGAWTDEKVINSVALNRDEPEQNCAAECCDLLEPPWPPERLASDGQKRVSHEDVFSGWQESALEFMDAYFVYSYPCFDPRASRTVAGL